MPTIQAQKKGVSMPTDTEAKKIAENETPNEPMPSSESKTENVSEREVAPEEVSSQESQTASLPDDAKERTKQEFEKLQTKLRDERARREYLETVFNSLQPKAPPEKPKEVEVPMYDPTTGLLNEQYLTDVNRRAREAEERAKRAEEAVKSYERQQMQTRDEQQKKEAFTSYPQLNPSAKNFDRELHVATRRIILDSMMNPDDYGGKEISFREAADIASKTLPKSVEGAKEEGQRQALESLTPKEQAAYEATGTSGRRTQVSDDNETLSYKSRKGDINAIAERLRRLKANQK